MIMGSHLGLTTGAAGEVDQQGIIIGVDIKEEIQLRRLKIRDQEKSAFLKRINDLNNQFNDHYQDLDFVILNNNDLSSLEKETLGVINKVLSRLN